MLTRCSALARRSGCRTAVGSPHAVSQWSCSRLWWQRAHVTHLTSQITLLTYYSLSQPAKDTFVMTTQPTFCVVPPFHIRNAVPTRGEGRFCSQCCLHNASPVGYRHRAALHPYVLSLILSQRSEF